MMHRRMRSRRLASALAAVLAPAALFTAAVAPASVEAAPTETAPASKAQCQAHAVLATKDGDGTIPSELKFLEEQLKDDQFAAYKGFRLLEQKALELAMGTPTTPTTATTVRFTSGNRLSLSLLGSSDTHLKLRADLSSRDGKKSLLGTDYSIEDAGVLMIGAGKYTFEKQDGKLFFAIQCARSG